ncbi:Uu.00g075320.m01.CDS01 [Anthostomella pinea]|uniref:Uu.00g075320.m01.CDS01 n=1 Tax=Anthostomella pinea TaxID=933095 RepID=A0AAI8VVN1_9PEZI|nr:Uu.00g075320.m01.CDS01 [Anthostomella pinea]
MPVRIPKARGSETAIISMAGVTAFAPFYFMMPGAEERLTSQTTHWAPRWERNISHFAPPAQNIAQRIEPGVGRTVQKINNKLPLERMALTVDRRIKAGIDRMSKR